MGHGAKIVLLLSDSGNVLQEFYSINEASRELGIDVESVRNYFGGKHLDAKEGVGVHFEQGPDGGVVTLDDTRILDAAMRILNEQK